MNLPKDLQKKNFYDIMLKMKPTSGWEILAKNNLLALKAGAKIPLINFVWGDATLENIEAIKKFYVHHSFIWLLTLEQNDMHLLNAGFKGPDQSPEMVLCLDNYEIEGYLSDIKVIIAESDEQLNQWTQVASEAFEKAPADLKEFFEPLIKVGGAKPFLIYYKNMPAATSLVYCNNNIAGIYAVSALEKFRRKGLGKAATLACIREAKNRNISNAVLYASPMGKFLYESMGFKISQTLNEYFFMNQKEKANPDINP